MLSRLYPNCLVLTGLLTVSALRAADVVAGGESTDQISTTQASFSEFKDPYSHNGWMVVEIDFVGKSQSAEKWIQNVTVSLTMAWGEGGSSPQIDTALSASIDLISVEAGKHSAVFFFVPPEVLGHDPHGTYEDAKAPTFYVVQFSVGGNPLTPGKLDYSTQTLPDTNFVKGFLNKAAAKAERAMLLTESTVPSYVLAGVLNRLTNNGSAFPTYLHSSDAGH